MTAREQIIETMDKACEDAGYISPDGYNASTLFLDAIPPALLWDWLIETGKVERALGVRQEPVFRLVPE